MKGWRAQDFKQVTGLNVTPIETHHATYNMWIENSISSADCKNGLTIKNISKQKYLFDNEKLNVSIIIEEKKKARKKCIFQKTE